MRRNRMTLVNEVVCIGAGKKYRLSVLKKDIRQHAPLDTVGV